MIPGFNDSVRLGPHTVVMSGFIDFKLYPDSELDLKKETLIVDIPDSPKWKLLNADENGHLIGRFSLYASTIITWGWIQSHDSDEVDQSQWGIEERATGYRDATLIGEKPNVQIRLSILVGVQGKDNSWHRLGFQTIANGTLAYPDDVAAKKLEPIPDPNGSDRVAFENG